MKKRATGQSSFSDLAVAGLGGPKTAALLAKLDGAVPWGELVKPVLKLPEYAKYIEDPSRPGERPIDPAVMLRGLMLQKWFNLSDPQLEEQLKDRISFRRFAGLSQQDPTPDETTFVKFRGRLREAKLDEVIFAAVLRHVQSRGLLVKGGTIVDATIVEQSTGHKTGRKDEQGNDLSTREDRGVLHQEARHPLPRLQDAHRHGCGQRPHHRRGHQHRQPPRQPLHRRPGRGGGRGAGGVRRQRLQRRRASPEAGEAWRAAGHPRQAEQGAEEAARVAEEVEQAGVAGAGHRGAPLRLDEAADELHPLPLPGPATQRLRLHHDRGGVQPPQGGQPADGAGRRRSGVMSGGIPRADRGPRGENQPRNDEKPHMRVQ